MGTIAELYGPYTNMGPMRVCVEASNTSEIFHFSRGLGGHFALFVFGRMMHDHLIDNLFLSIENK